MWIGPVQLSGIRLSVPSRLSYVAAAGLLLWNRMTGDIDRLFHGQRAGGQQRRVVATERGECRVVV